jgi:rhodanese-related sulfurtransferase
MKRIALQVLLVVILAGCRSQLVSGETISVDGGMDVWAQAGYPLEK